MVRKDYLLRVIEQFAAFLEKILFHKQVGDYAGAEQQIDETVKTLLGVDPASLFIMSVDTILNELIGKSGFDMDICLVVAELYNQKADVATAGNSGSLNIDFLEKSFLLYAEAIRHGADNLAYRDRILAIIAALRRHDIAETTKTKFFWYYELCGLFGKAEDVLYDLVETSHEGIRRIGLEFYKRLNDREDILLALGNLPRNEVQEGYLYFSGMKDTAEAKP